MEPEVAWPGVPPGPLGSCGEEREKMEGGKGREKKKKKLIKKKNINIPSSFADRCLQQLCPCHGAAMAQLGGCAKSRIWEKTVFKHRWIKPLLPFKLHFNALATLEVLGLAGLSRFGMSVPREPAKPNP